MVRYGLASKMYCKMAKRAVKRRGAVVSGLKATGFITRMKWRPRSSSCWKSSKSTGTAEIRLKSAGSRT